MSKLAAAKFDLYQVLGPETRAERLFKLESWWLEWVQKTGVTVHISAEEIRRAGDDIGPRREHAAHHMMVDMLMKSTAIERETFGSFFGGADTTFTIFYLDNK